VQTARVGAAATTLGAPDTRIAMTDQGLVDHCLELLAPLGATRARRMFSGHALYVDDLCVALVLRETLYLKTDDASRPAFEAAGCAPFTYAMKTGEIKSLGYYAAPGEAMESPAEMLPWARRALAAALAARAAKAPGKRPRAAAAKKPPARKTAPRKAAGRP
jgi:DNA transformation protein